MGWFLGVWLCLSVSLAGATTALSFVVYRHLDLRYVALVRLLVIPTVQTAVVGWVQRRWSLSRLLRAAGDVLRHRIVAVLLLIDAVVLWLGHLRAGLAPGGGVLGGAITLWSGLQLGAAGALLLAASVRPAGRRRHVWLAGLTICTLTAAVWLSLHALGIAPEPLDGVVPRAARWLVGSALLAAIALLALVRAAAVVRESSALAASSFELAAGCLFTLMLVVELNVALHPFLTEPWATMARVLALSCATFVLAGSVLARPTPGGANPRGAS